VHVSMIQDVLVERAEDVLEIGQDVRVRILFVNSGSGRIDLTMREYGGFSRNPADFAAFRDIPSDQWLTGMVARFEARGASVAVKVPGSNFQVEGWLHETELRDGFAGSAKELMEINQEVKVRVLSVAPDFLRMRLSMSEEVGISEDPRDYREMEEPGILSIVDGARPNRWLSAKVSSVRASGAKLTVQAPTSRVKLRGWLRTSRLSEDWVEDARTFLEVGQELKVRVLSADVDKRSLALTLREDDGTSFKRADYLAFDEMPSDRKFAAKIFRITPSAVMACLPSLEGNTRVRGILSDPDLGDAGQESFREGLEVGQVVDVRVLSVDPKERMLTLSLSESAPTPPKAQEVEETPQESRQPSEKDVAVGGKSAAGLRYV